MHLWTWRMTEKETWKSNIDQNKLVTDGDFWVCITFTLKWLQIHLQTVPHFCTWNTCNLSRLLLTCSINITLRWSNILNQTSEFKMKVLIIDILFKIYKYEQMQDRCFKNLFKKHGLALFSPWVFCLSENDNSNPDLMELEWVVMVHMCNPS